MNKSKIFAIVIVILAILATRIMIKISRKSPTIRPAAAAPAVRVKTVAPTSVQARLHATATVEANQTLSLTPEIAGRVVWVSPKLIAGGTVKKGEQLIKLDDRDYKLAVEQVRVQVKQAQLQIDQEKARGEVAREEWSVLGESDRASDLVLRVQHLEVAKLSLRSAKSALKKAELNLSRTRIRAPFDSYISQKTVSVGQFVSQQSPLARILEKDNLKAEVTLSMNELKWIEIPGIDDVKEGSSVVITQNTGNGSSITSEGTVTALIGEIDQQTRRARLFIDIESVSSSSVPLLPGAFVQVEIYGKTIDNGIEIPREAIIGGNSAYSLNEDSTIDRIQFERLWSTNETVIIYGENSEPVTFLMTRPSGVVKGMKVTPIGEKFNRDRKNDRDQKGEKDEQQ